MNSKWHELGTAVGMPSQTLDDLASYSEDECMVEVADYWLRQLEKQYSWDEVARILKKIGFHQLANELLDQSVPEKR